MGRGTKANAENQGELGEQGRYECFHRCTLMVRGYSPVAW